MSWRRKRGEEEGSVDDEARESGSGGCLMDLIASTWVDFFHAAFVGRHALQEENKRLRMSAVRQDLDSCYSSLQQRESELQIRLKLLGRQAVAYKQGKNLAAARKKMLERARVQSQLDKLQNSILMIDMHRSTLEGTALDITVLEALKASGDVLRQMGATGQGLRAVEELVSGIEENMQSAAEITNVLSTGSVAGVVNSMASYGIAVDEEDLMRELDSMTLDSEGEAVVVFAEDGLKDNVGEGQDAAYYSFPLVPSAEAASTSSMKNVGKGKAAAADAAAAVSSRDSGGAEASTRDAQQMQNELPSGFRQQSGGGEVAEPALF